VPIKFTKAADSEHKEKLTSSLIAAAWRTGAAYAGEKASFEVLTAFVGEGADISITGKSDNGKSLGKIKDKIKNNKFIGEFDIPDDIKLDDFVFFEVDLSKNGVKGDSNRIPVRPAIKVTNMKWSAKEARRGDTLTLSADIDQVKDGTEVMLTVYEYDRDDIHDKIVELPTAVQNKKIELLWEYEYHEDTDQIPTDEKMKKYGKNYNPPEYFFTVKVEGKEFGKKQESGILTFKDWLEIRVVDKVGRPLPDRDCTITLPDGTQKKGKTDANGYVRVTDVPPGECKVEFSEPQQQQQQQSQQTGSN